MVYASKAVFMTKYVRLPVLLGWYAALLFLLLSTTLVPADDSVEQEEPTDDPRAEDETATLEIVNAGEYELLMLFVSPADSDFFGPDVLGSEDTLAPDSSRTVSVHADDECFDYDILGIDVDGFAVYSILPVCDGAHEVIQLGEDGILEEQVAFEHFMRVEITNRQEGAITSLFAAAVDSRYRGANLLTGSERIEPDETRSFYIADTEGVSYTIFAALDTGETLTTRLHLHEFRQEQIDIVRIDIDSDLPLDE